MGDPQELSDIQRLLKERGRQYGDTWKLAGEVVHYISLDNFKALLDTPYTHNWVQILGKLIRALFSPANPDHWRDIAGYATLVADDIIGRTHAKNVSSE